MRRNAKLQIALAICLCVAGVGLCVVGFGLWKWLEPLPHPRDAGMRDLARWLLQRDLAEEPREIQVSLVNRLPTELKKDFTFPRQRSWSDNAHELLLQNVIFLGKVWFEERAGQYQQLNKTERLPFLVSQIITVSRWSVLEAELSRPQLQDSESTTKLQAEGAPGPHPAQGSLRLFQRIETWVQESKGKQRAILEQAVRDATLCSLATDDLSDQPLAVRRDLADRIASFLNEDGNSIGSRLQFEPGHYQQLSSNSLLLMEAWLLNRTLEYAPLSAAEKNQYIEEKLEQMNRWNLDNLFSATKAGESSASKQGTLKLLTRILPHLETWINRAEPAQQEMFRNLIQDFKSQLFINQFRGAR